MTKLSTETIEKYQTTYQKDPNSQVFAPLIEAYIQMGLLKEAEQIGRHGIKKHPEFPGGRLAFAKVLLELKKIEEAYEELKKATELAPENIAAQKLYAQTCLEMKKTKEALKAYKMLLFLNPQNETAQKAVQKLESLTADEYEDEVFSMEHLKPLANNKDSSHKTEKRDNVIAAAKKVGQPTLSPIAEFERKLSLADAFLVRFETDKAKSLLQDLQKEFGPRKEITNRLYLLSQNQSSTDESEIIEPMTSRNQQAHSYKLQLLEELLHRVTALKQNP